MDLSGEVRRVSDEILGRIVSGIYPSGLRLPSETDLAVEFSCGRSTIREALRHLTGLGVVRSRRGSGALVRDYRREGTPALLPWYIFTGQFDRPAPVLARELLGLRGLLATQAVRLAARYAEPQGIAEARGILARAPSLENDFAAHALNELELFRALVCASGIWPAVWLANVFWAPMRELHALLAASVGKIPSDYQAQMERLVDRIEARDEAGAAAHLGAWLTHVDETLLHELEQVLRRSPPAAMNSGENAALGKAVKS
jgi:GntR family transcriptional regulator, transcriptional repressor for pyruvate dehydrogenase complex